MCVNQVLNYCLERRVYGSQSSGFTAGTVNQYFPRFMVGKVLGLQRATFIQVVLFSEINRAKFWVYSGQHLAQLTKFVLFSEIYGWQSSGFTAGTFNQVCAIF